MRAPRLGSIVWSLALALACALMACRDTAAPTRTLGEGARPNTRSPTPSGEAHAATAAALTEEEPAPPSLWPETPQPIAIELARTETREACAARIRASLAAEVAESIEAFGYDRFVEDVCAGLAAVRTGDASACDALSVSFARSSCRRRVALVHGQPDACPEDPTMRGREPVCLAWAARDVGLCRSAAVGERERCEAVLAGDGRRCRVLPPELRTRCMAEVSRYGAALGVARVTSDAREVEPQLALTVTVDAQHETTHAIEADAGVATPPVLTISGPPLDRGIVLARCADGLRVQVGDTRRHGSALRLDGPAEAELLLRWPSTAPPGPLSVSAAEHNAIVRLRIPHESDTTSDPGGTGTVTLEAHEVTRGALFAGTVDLTLRMPGGPGHVTGSFRTFVRDVLGADAEECLR